MIRAKALMFVVMLPALIGGSTYADDVKITPAAGNGVVVTNATSTVERLRVNENGQVFLPALAPQPSADRTLCIDSVTGRVGTCAQQAVGPVGPPGPPGSAGPAGLTWKGAWNSATPYVVNDAVNSGGSAYVAVVANTGQQPGVGASWNLLAQKGADGVSPDIIQVCASQVINCLTSQPCAVGHQGPCIPGDKTCDCKPGDTNCTLDADYLTATCPAGYIRLSFVACNKPNADSFHAKPYFDPYDNQSIACAYSGVILSTSQEVLVTRMLCIKEFAVPCLNP